MALENIGLGVMVCFSAHTTGSLWLSVSGVFLHGSFLILGYHFSFGSWVHRGYEASWGLQAKRRYVRGLASICFSRLCIRAGS